MQYAKLRGGVEVSPRVVKIQVADLLSASRKMLQVVYDCCGRAVGRGISAVPLRPAAHHDRQCFVFVTGCLPRIDYVCVIHDHVVAKAVRLLEGVLIGLLRFVVGLLLQFGFPTCWAVRVFGHVIDKMFRRNLFPVQPAWRANERFKCGGGM